MSKVIRKVVSAQNAPKPIAPYSQAIIADRFVYVSGCLGTTPGSKLVDGGIIPQTSQALENLKNILEAAGSSFSKVVKTTVLLQTMDDYKDFNSEYAKVFNEGCPARTCFAVKELPLKASVEIEAVALTGDVAFEISV